MANRKLFNLDQSKYRNNELPNNQSKYYLNALNFLGLLKKFPMLGEETIWIISFNSLCPQNNTLHHGNNCKNSGFNLISVHSRKSGLVWNNNLLKRDRMNFTKQLSNSLRIQFPISLTARKTDCSWNTQHLLTWAYICLCAQKEN